MLNTSTDNPLLNVESLSLKLEGRTILDGLTAHVRAGELVALLGPNGAGKSTLVKAVAGEVEAASGGIAINRRPLSQWPRAELARHRAVMPQKIDMQFPLTAYEVVALGRPREPMAQRQRIVTELLTLMDVADLAQRRVPTLSGGEQQRVQLARVLAQLWEQPHPGLFLLDECTSALDPAHQQLVFNRLRQLANSGNGLLVAVHDLNLAAQWADRLILMNHGKVAVEGSPESVLTADNLMQIYGLDARVITLAEGYPVVLPIRPAHLAVAI